jgi:hypothetical protein
VEAQVPISLMVPEGPLGACFHSPAQLPFGVVGNDGWQVFIAYTSRERASADELYEHLVRGGARAFLDHIALLPGDRWAAEIIASQREARVTAVLVSKATDRAFYQNEEIAQAIALFRKDPQRHRVVPVYLDGEADPPYGLRSIHALWVPKVGGMAGVAAALLPLVGLGSPGAQRPAPLPGAVRVSPAPPRRSPFRPGMPLYASDFLPGASRRALLQAMSADVDAGANVNLVGERRMGRTSVLNHLYGPLVAEADQVVVRVNFQDDVGTEGHFYGGLLWGIGQCRVGEKTLEPARVRELERVPVAAYAELRRVLRAVRREATPVVLLDEFERCFDSPEGFPVPFFDNLRSLLGGDEHGPYARAVVATRQPLARYFTSRQVTSTLPSYLPVRQMELLTDADVDEALAQESPYRLGPAQREHAARLAGRHPCRVQSAGEAWYRALEGGRDEQWTTVEFARLSEQTCLGAAPYDARA